jgi:hypothetical protein
MAPLPPATLPRPPSARPLSHGASQTQIVPRPPPCSFPFSAPLFPNRARLTCRTDHLPIDHVRHVTASSKELHHPSCRSVPSAPTGISFLDSAPAPNFVAVEHEINLPKSALGSSPDKIMLFPKLDHHRALDEGPCRQIRERIILRASRRERGLRNVRINSVLNDRRFTAPLPNISPAQFEWVVK